MAERIDIGIDGGGSGCRVVVSCGTRMARAEGGPANVATDPAAAEAAIRGALLDALGQMSLSLDDMQTARIVAGLAGCRLPGLADTFAMRLPFLAHVVDDSVTALEGAFGGAQGTLIGLGTGSFCIRHDARGITHQGGWGFALGDEGSAASLGRIALSELLRIEDGRLPKWSDDPLIDRLQAAVGVHPVLFARDAGPEDFAALAPLVVDCDSPWAEDLIHYRVYAEILTALRQIGHPEGAAWAMTGGFAAALKPRWAHSMQAGLQDPLGSPLDGALAMARALP